VGVVTGVSEMHVESGGKDQRFTVRYLAVYTKSGDHWRMIVWQSTRPPEAYGGPVMRYNWISVDCRASRSS
jgi:ketosteroid isomerase-like protein